MGEHNSTKASNGEPPPDGGEPHPIPEDETTPPEAEPDELTRAALAARATLPTGRGWRGPASLWILAGVLLAVVAVGLWTVVYGARIGVRNAELRLHSLEQQQRDYEEQADFRRTHGYRPAGKEAAPLSAAEIAELQDLRRRLGMAPAPTGPATTLPTPAPPAASQPASQPLGTFP